MVTDVFLGVAGGLDGLDVGRGGSRTSEDCFFGFWPLQPEGQRRKGGWGLEEGTQAFRVGRLRAFKHRCGTGAWMSAGVELEGWSGLKSPRG